MRHGRLDHGQVWAQYSAGQLPAEIGRSIGGLQVDRPGGYGFICTVPGRAATGRRGTLIVEV